MCISVGLVLLWGWTDIGKIIRQFYKMARGLPLIKRAPSHCRLFRPYYQREDNIFFLIVYIVWLVIDDVLECSRRRDVRVDDK